MARPLFILAPARSFSSVISAMIGSHPQMMGLAETHLFLRSSYADLARIYKVRPQSQDGLLRVIAELGLGGQTEENVDAAKLWLEENRSMNTADLFRDLAAWAEPRELVDKGPMYAQNLTVLERIEAAFPEARYLHVTRHPRDTSESTYALVHAPGRRRQFIADEDLTPERIWLEPHLNIVEFLENVEERRHMRIRGEELLSDPDLYLRQIAEWLEISTTETAIASMMHPEESPFSHPGPPNARLGNDPSFLDNPELRPYEKREFGDLEAPLSWNPELTFSEAVKQYALYFGYG